MFAGFVPSNLPGFGTFGALPLLRIGKKWLIPRRALEELLAQAAQRPGSNRTT